MKLKIPTNKIILYGSSMGGFGALMIAGYLKDSFAIAEVPQINLLNYPIKNALKLLEEHIFEGESIENFVLEHPEMINVLDRWKSLQTIPPFRLITNSADTEHIEHLEFLSLIDKLKKDVKTVGDIHLTVVSEEIGHKPLPTAYGIKFIRTAIQEGWTISNKKLNYQSLIQDVVKRSQEIKYIRDKNETIEYNEIKKILYLAASLNEAADWPYLKICSMTKLWTNSFNAEILDAAEKAFERRESLEAFIYICRGLLFNKDAATAQRELEILINKTLDKNIANVGYVFKAILAYEEGKYEEYEKLIEIFQNNKNEDFEAYITIPVSTVYTKSLYADELYMYNDVKLLNHKLSLAEFQIFNEKYIISASCDEKYFFKYAKYLIKSFSKFCSDEAILHLSVVNGNREEVNNALNEWDSKSVFVSIQNLEVENNIGPIASLLRFSHVFQLLSKYKIPVFVLDLDTVIKKSFLSLLDECTDADIGSRILGSGVAPWEKYTGGFALFNPTKTGTYIAQNIAYIAESICHDNALQWWIDQNCFEAGIRWAYRLKKKPEIKNLFAIRDLYCNMPVGSGDSKIHNLEKALSELH